ncbi:Phospholipase [Escherichia phage vB_Eco_TB34]|nr:Phospholipase [Escherichia phage vB_Eco_TB34]
MAGLSYDKAKTTGHGNYPPTVINATQSKVFVEGIPVLVEGDPITPHTKTTKPYDTHGELRSPVPRKYLLPERKQFKWQIVLAVAIPSLWHHRRYS